MFCPRRCRRACGRCLIRTGQNCDRYGTICIDRISYAAGPFLVGLVFILVIGLSLLGYWYVIPTQCSTTFTRNLARVYLTLGLFNIITRYIYAVGTNPGNSLSAAYARLIQEYEKHEQQPSSSTELAEDVVLPVRPPNMIAWSTCKHTKLLKPPRAHYDSVNKHLIVNFDHWCPWLFNSVGYGNYRHFLFFVFWVWALTSVGALLTIKPFLEGLKRGRLLHDDYTETSFVIVFCLCLALMLAVGILLGWHVYLVMSGQTTIDCLVLSGRRERIDVDYPNPFDYGSIPLNIENVLLSENGGWWEIVIPPLPTWKPKGPPFRGAW